MNKLISFLNGKKTYISLGLAAFIWFAQYEKWITSDEYDLLIKLDASFFGIGITNKFQKFIDAVQSMSPPTIVNQHVDLVSPQH